MFGARSETITCPCPAMISTSVLSVWWTRSSQRWNFHSGLFFIIIISFLRWSPFPPAAGQVTSETGTSWICPDWVSHSHKGQTIIGSTFHWCYCRILCVNLLVLDIKPWSNECVLPGLTMARAGCSLQRTKRADSWNLQRTMREVLSSKWKPLWGPARRRRWSSMFSSVRNTDIKHFPLF